mmetsp:Transcript_19268/g.72790  ORF Transcript_19268/g.72790 Transcript_19268/m.72790 type:complete len:684 (-) Transcript_19268:93-2144(-)
MDDPEPELLAWHHVQRPSFRLGLEDIRRRRRGAVGVQALDRDDLDGVVGTGHGKLEGGGGAQHRAGDEPQQLDAHLLALGLLDEDRLAGGRVGEEGDRRRVEPRTVAEAVRLEEGRLRVGHHRLDVLLEALQARGPAIGEEQHVVEVRVRRLDHALQLGAEGVVVGAAGAPQCAGFLQEILLKLLEHVVRRRVRQRNRAMVPRGAGEGPEVHRHRLVVDGVLAPQRLDVARQRAHHALQERHALLQEGHAAVHAHARRSGLVDDQEDAVRRLARTDGLELAGRGDLDVAEVLGAAVLRVEEHVRAHDALGRLHGALVLNGDVAHLPRELLEHGIDFLAAEAHEHGARREDAVRGGEASLLRRVLRIGLQHDEASRRQLVLVVVEQAVAVGMVRIEDLDLVQAVLGNRKRHLRNAVLGAEGHLEGEGDGATFLNTRHARGDEHVRHDHGVLISVLHDHLHFDRPGLEETRGEVGRRARRNLVDLDFEELVVGVGNGGRVGLGRGRLLELLLGGLLLHHLGQVVHLAGLVALFQEQQALDPRDLQQRGGYSIFPGVLKVHPDGVHGILRRHMRLYRHRRRQDPPLVLYKGRPKRHNALHEAPDRSLLLLRGLGAADREAHRAQDAVGSLQVQCVVGLDVVTWLRRLRNLDGVLAVGFGGDQASLAAEQHARVVAEQLRWRLHLVA